VTDACMDFPTTEAALHELAAAVRSAVRFCPNDPWLTWPNSPPAAG